MKCQAGLQIVFFAKPLQKRRNRLGPCQQVRVNSVKYMHGPRIPLGFIFDDLAETWVPELELSTHLSLVRRIFVSVVVFFSQFCFHQAMRMKFPLWGTLSRTTTKHQHHHKQLLCQTCLFHQPPSPRTCCRLARIWAWTWRN